MDGKRLNNFSCSEHSSVSHIRDDEIVVNITDASFISTTIPGENKISSLVDTGSSKCLISAGTVKDSRYLSTCPRRTLDKAVCFIVGNGSRMYTSTVIDFQVKLSGEMVNITAHIVPNLGGFKLILGVDFLKKLGAIIDYRSNIVRLRKKKIQVKPTRRYRIAANSHCYIMVKANVPAAIKSNDLIISATPHFRRVAPAHCLVKLRKGTTMLRVANVTSKPIHLSNHMSIGHINTNDLGLIYREPEQELGNEYLNSFREPTMDKQKCKFFPCNGLIDRQEICRRKLELYPFLDADDPRLTMTDEEILDRDITLTNSRLSSKGKAELRQILSKHKEAFALHSEVGTCNDSNIKFELKENDGLFVRPYVTSTADKEVMLKEVDKLVKMGILKKARTSYLSPLLLVRHPVTKKPRVVTDFRKLNELIKKEHVPVPMARDAIDAIGRAEAKFITILDIKAAYHSLLLAAECQDYTGVCPFPGGPTYKYSRVPMGLRISGSQFNQYMENIMDGDLPKWRDFLFIIADDMAIHSRTEKEHIYHIEQVLKVITNHGLKLAADKAQIAKHSITYMGFTITYDSKGNPVMKADKQKTDAISKFPQPKTIRDVRSLAGMVNYLSKFLPKLQDTMKPIYHLTKKKAKFEWGEEQQKSFDKLKYYLQNSPVLAMPTSTGEFVVYSDTSKVATGASLWQIQDGEEKLIAYHSKSLPPSAARWSISELELTGLYYNLLGFKHALKGNYFQAKVDHSALTYIWKARTEPPTMRLKKILEKLQDFDFDLSYEKGINLKIADALSRNPAADDAPGTPVRAIAFSEVARKLLGSVHRDMELENIVENNMDKAYIPREKVNTVFLTEDHCHVSTRSGNTEIVEAGDFTNYRTKSADTPETSPMTPVVEPTWSRPSTPTASVETATPPARVEPKRISVPPARLEYATRGGIVPRQTVEPERNAPMTRPQTPTRTEPEDNRRPATKDTFIGSEGSKRVTTNSPKDIIDRERGSNNADWDITPDVEEIYVPDSLEHRPRERHPLFKDVKRIKYRFPKQRDIDPLLRIIKNRAISDFNVSTTQKELKLEQRKDPSYKDIIQYLACDMLPKDKLSARNIMHRAEEYALVEDILFRVPQQQKSGKPERIQLCIPDSLVGQILDCHHTSILGGHQGITRTCEELRRKYYFRNMLERVSEYIAGCDLCQEHRDPVKKAFPMKRRLHPDWSPFKYLSIDVKIMHPSKSGYKGILVCVCECSNYMEAFPIKTGTSIEVAEILTQNIIQKHGIPTQIAFDCSRSFQNELIDHILKALNISVKFVNPAAHHAHKVERYIYTLQEYLIRQLRSNGDLWDLYLNAAVYCHNNTATPSLGGYSPYYIRFLQHPPSLDRIDIPPLSHSRPSVVQYVDLLRKRQKFIKEGITRLREVAQEKQRIVTSKNANIKGYEIGDIVYLASPTHSELVTSSKKICLKWVGPYIIYNMLNDTNTILQALDGTIISTVVSTHRLKHATIRTKEGKILRNKGEIVQSLNDQQNLDAKGLIDKLSEINVERMPTERLFSSIQHKSNLMLIGEGFTILEPTDNHQTGQHQMEKAQFNQGELQVLVSNPKEEGKTKTWVDLHDTHDGINIAIKILNGEFKVPIKGNPAGARRKRSNPKVKPKSKLVIEPCPDLVWDDCGTDFDNMYENV